MTAMALWQRSMIRLARSDRVTEFAQSQGWMNGLARQFVCGATAADAVRASSELAGAGIATTLFYLGEYVTDPRLVAETVARLREGLDATAHAGLDVSASVDPTQIGLMVDEATCLANARILAQAVLAAAPAPRPGHDTLMIDMEDSGVTHATLDLYGSLHDEGLPVAVTIQAYLHRTRGDLERLVAGGAWVRLVKGAFAEAATVAVRGTVERDSRYRQCVAQLLSPAARSAGVFPSFATHDHRMIEEIIAHAEANEWPADAFEFEMLYGVRPGLQRSLVRRGYRVRLYLPFGSDWFPYAIRRVGESPRNLAFVGTTLARRLSGPRG